MPKEDKLGPEENQSPVWKRRPTTGANLKPDPDYVFDSIMGGNKHAPTGGSESEYHDQPGECEKSAKANYGIEAPESPYEEEFDEGSGYDNRSQGATLEKGSVD